MPKSSLIEQLDAAVQAIVGTPGASPPEVDLRVTRLIRIAGGLRSLPRENFKARLKSDLEREASMATVAEPAAAVRTVATPRLAYKDVAKAIAFYQKALEATETWRFNLEGRVGHAEMKIGDSPILLSVEWPEGGRFSAETLGQSPVELRIFVDDVDSFAARAVAAGMKVARPIEDQFYGTREGHLVDPFGYTWNIFTIKEEMSAEEVQRRFNAMQSRAPQPAVDPIPKGYRTVTPYLVAADGPALLEFAKQALGAEEMFRTVGSAGGMHAEARIGDSMLMIGGGIPGREFRSTPNIHALHIYVEDCDATYRKALDAGATSIGEPADQEYGERSAGVKDPAGNYWYIATHKGGSYIQKGLNHVNVYLHPLRAEPLIMFLRRAFGAQEIAKYASPDGVVHHAQVRVGSSMVEMGEAHGPYQPMSSMFYLYVPDCDAVYRQALGAGGTSIAEPKDQPYGDRSAGVKDPFGNQWYIATHIKDVAM